MLVEMGFILICLVLLTLPAISLGLENYVGYSFIYLDEDFLFIHIFSLFFIVIVDKPFCWLELDFNSFSRLLLFIEFYLIFILGLDSSIADDLIRADKGCDVSVKCVF